MPKIISPKVFISHATEDKDRFVRNFATKLLEKGVDAWYDEWEIGPGDRIVKKVFDEGLDTSKVFIAILSKISITKRWVQEELDAATIKSIEESARIIPIIIDGLKHEDIPLALRKLRYVRIDVIDNYDNSLHEIVQKIFGANIKPAIGTPPVHLTTDYPKIPGLKNTDMAMMKVLGDLAIDQGAIYDVSFESFAPKFRELGIPETIATESLQILDGRDIVKAKAFGLNQVISAQLTPYGFDLYLSQYFAGYPDLIRNVGLRIVNDNLTDLDDIAATLDIPNIVVDAALNTLESRGDIKTASSLMGRINARVYYVSPALRRWLDDE